MNSEISKRISFLGFAMTCVIVVYHCGTVGGASVGSLDESLSSFVSASCNELAVLAMSHFFAVTGFLLFRKLSFSSLPSKLKRRTLTLLLPYAIWQLFFFVFNWLLMDKAFSIREFVGTVFLFQAWPPNGALWYLFAVYALAFASPLFLLAFKCKKFAFAFVVAAWFSCYWVLYAEGNPFSLMLSYGYLGNIAQYFPSYLLGAYCGYYAEENNENSQLVICLLLVFVSLLAGQLGGAWEWVLGFSVTSVLPIGLLYLFPVGLIPQRDSIFKLSFLVYAIHQPFIPLVMPHLGLLVTAVIPGAALPNVVARLLYLALVLVVAYLLTRLLKPKLHKVLDMLTGGRN